MVKNTIHHKQKVERPQKTVDNICNEKQRNNFMKM